MSDRRAEIERDWYRDNMLAQAQIAGEALVERDKYRDKLGRVIDAVHAIVRMMDE